MKPFDRRALDGAVHAPNQTAGPRVVGLGQAVLDPVGFADHVEAHLPGIGCVSVPGLIGALEALIGQDRVDLSGNDLQQMLQELPCRPPVRLFNELGERELARSVECHEETGLAFGYLHSISKTGSVVTLWDDRRASPRVIL